jgi:outer membrane protein, heavy metal efflux system
MPDLPEKNQDDGMTLGQAIDRFLKENLELRAMRDEIAMARADVEAAGQPPQAHLLIDVGVGGIETRLVQPGEFILARWARILAARAAMRVTEAQYDDAVRTRLDNLCTAFVNAQEARTRVDFAGVNLRGIQGLVSRSETLVKIGQIKQADLSELKTRRDLAALARAEAEITLRKTTLVLANLLNLPDADAEKLRLSDDEAETAATAREAPAVEDLILRARDHRPDLRAYRLGLERAQLEWLKALVEPLNQIKVHPWPEPPDSLRARQPRNEQIWRVTAIVTLPTTIRNRGVLKRAAINVAQTRTELAKVERGVVLDVRKARMDYEQYRSTLDRLRQEIIPEARKARDDVFRLFQGGEISLTESLDAQRDFNERLHQYREGIFRLRRSMLALDTAVGERIMP